MKNRNLKSLLLSSITLLFTAGFTYSQTSFIEYKRASYRNDKTGDIFLHKEDTLRKEFEAKGLQWPAKYVYIRSFKYDAQLEVWVKSTAKEQYKLFKTYKVCMQSGTM